MGPHCSMPLLLSQERLHCYRKGETLPFLLFRNAPSAVVFFFYPLLGHPAFGFLFTFILPSSSKRFIHAFVWLMWLPQQETRFAHSSNDICIMPITHFSFSLVHYHKYGFSMCSLPPIPNMDLLLSRPALLTKKSFIYVHTLSP